MRRVAPTIGVAEIPRGLLISLPPRFWLLVSLRRACPRAVAAAEPWTYLVPGAGAARRVGEWIAAVDLDLIAEARRRAWTEADADWSGTAAVPPAVAVAAVAGPVVIEIPPKGTARATLKLIRRMQAGQVLVVTAGKPGQPRSYQLSPSGRPVRAAIAERAIGGRYLVPSCDGLFGPDWSQTWRAPEQEKPNAAAKRRRKEGAEDCEERPDRPARPVQRPAPGGTGRRPRARGQGEVVGDGRGRALPSRRGGVACVQPGA